MNSGNLAVVAALMLIFCLLCWNHHNSTAAKLQDQTTGIKKKLRPAATGPPMLLPPPTPAVSNVRNRPNDSLANTTSLANTPNFTMEMLHRALFLDGYTKEAAFEGSQVGSNLGASIAFANGGQIVAFGAVEFGQSPKGNGEVFVYQLVSGAATNAVWQQKGQTLVGDADGDFSGKSVGMSEDGDRLVIGTPQGDFGSQTGNGYFDVYNYNDATSMWDLLQNTGGAALGDLAGWSVDMTQSGRFIAVGSPRNDNSGIEQGRVDIYEYDSTTQTYGSVASLFGQEQYDGFGTSVSCSGNRERFAIGAIQLPVAGGGSVERAGQVWVYWYASDGNWKQLKGPIVGENPGDEFGFQVSFNADGNILAASGIRNIGNGEDAGHVQVFQFGDGTWTQLGSDMNAEAAGDKSGHSISLSDDGYEILIGATHNDGNDGYDSKQGHCRLWKYIGSDWVLQEWSRVIGTDLDGDIPGDWLGEAVALSGNGNKIAVGAAFYDSASGQVQIYSTT